MKNLTYILGFGAIASMFLAGCSNENILASGEGRVLLSTKISSDVVVASRADIVPDEAKLAEDLVVWISNSKGVIYQYHGMNEVPKSVNLLSGDYIAEAWTGDSVSASWDKVWYKGYAKFNVAPGQSTRVDLKCKIANTLVAVNFDETLDDVLKDYTMTVGHSRASLVYRADIDSTGYFMLPKADNNLWWKLEGTDISTGKKYTAEGTIDNVRRTAGDGSHQAYKFILNVSCATQEEDEFGGLLFDVVVEEENLEEIHNSFDVIVAPIIEGYGFNIDEETLGEMGTLPRRSVIVRSGIDLQSVVLQSADLAFLGGTSVDLIGVLGSSAEEDLQAAGISYEYSVADDATSMMKINFEKSFLNTLDNGIHTIRIAATDSKGKQSSATLTFNVSDASVIADADIPFADITPFKAVLRGTVAKEDIESVTFRYRKVGDELWTSVQAFADNGPLSRSGQFAKDTRVKAEISGLEPGTRYEWQMVADGWNTDSQFFETKYAEQLPNNSFEEGHYDGKVYLIFPQGGSKFWDSGNKGATTIGNSITVPTTAMYKSGNQALSLSSKWIVMKMAAGNVFAGEYLETAGTDGVLGWGRPFMSRPKELKVWVHYTSKKIDHTGSNDPDKNAHNGQPDQGIIYAALMDDNLEDYNGRKFPVIIKTATSSRQLFEPNGRNKDHVIAYAEHIFTESTSGSELVELTIPFDYETYGKDINPSYIVFTASASRYGDYYTGGDGSTLILDDIEMVYDVE